MRAVPCVQQRLAYSAGDRPAGVRVRGPATWIAGWRETNILKPIDKVSEREMVSVQAVTKVNAQVAPKTLHHEGRACGSWAKAACLIENLTDAIKLELLYFHRQCKKPYLPSKGDMSNDRQRERESQTVQQRVQD